MSADTSVATGGTAASETTGQQRLLGGQLSMPNCIALSAAVMAPVIAVVLNAPAAAPNGQGALPLSFLAAFVGTAFVAVVVIQFSKRLPSSGLFYTYNGHALGGGAGFYTGWAYFAAYVMFAVGLFCATGSFLHTYLLSQFSVNINWWILSLIQMALIWVLSLRSIRASVRIDLTLLAFEMITFSVLAIIAIAKAGDHNTLKYFTPSSTTAGVKGVGLAAVFGILSFVGFESAAVLGEETKRPRRNVPLAVGGATLVVGVFYVFMMYTLSAGYGLNVPGNVTKFIADPTPFVTIANKDAHWMVNIIQIASVFGLFSCFLAVQNATVRVIFSMGRDGVLPGVFGRVHKRFHSPYTAIYALTGVSVIGGVLGAIWLGSGITDVYGWTGTIGTVAIIIVYMLACIGLIKFFWRDPERNIFWHVICPIVGIVAFAYPLYLNAKPNQPYPFNLVFWVVLGWLIIGAALFLYFRARAPEKLLAVGRVLADEETGLEEGKLASAPV
jgi:amino acid transporter